MRKASEVIQMAVEHPRYLNFEIDIPNRWLCSCIGDMEYYKEITAEEGKAAYSAVCQSIPGSNFLRAYLELTGKIPPDTRYNSQEYRDAANAHWCGVIERLQAQGL